MASPEAFDVVVERIADQWGGLTDVVFENDDYQLPDTATEFVYVEIFGGFFDQISLGAELREDNLWREAGQVSFHVMTPNNSGSRRARDLAKQLVNLFRGQDIDTVTFRDASIGAGDPGRKFANYYAMTATVNFERDE
ncbi:MAG: hypothetical protein EOS82_03465 [Mesorhizobium sp.]|uniref:hypothetical protein n=1 Tax=Mesorhizobium sp. TaxID=1871066 RepID=UPI000FEA8DEA|nr:hypothetical protein [Mesorhizobium sp.]RWQ56565.1 MAG: hypothetical protein EOS82_03465 [Mesorhizobium sp.]